LITYSKLLSLVIQEWVKLIYYHDLLMVHLV